MRLSCRRTLLPVWLIVPITVMVAAACSGSGSATRTAPATVAAAATASAPVVTPRPSPAAPSSTAAPPPSLTLLGHTDLGGRGFTANVRALDGFAYVGSWGSGGLCPALGV